MSSKTNRPEREPQFILSHHRPVTNFASNASEYIMGAVIVVGILLAIAIGADLPTGASWTAPVLAAIGF